MTDIVVPMPVFTDRQKAIIAKAKAKAHEIIDNGMDLVALEFPWREGESKDDASQRMLMILAKEMRSK